MAQELADKIRAAAQAKGIDPDVALSIARAESSLNPAAKAKTSTAGGLFQVIDRTWKEYGGRPGRKNDPDENIRVGTDIIAKNTQYLRNILQRDPKPAEVYAAHYFGPTGARSVISASPDTPIADILGKDAIRANPNLKGKTTGQVLASLEGKVGGLTKQPTVSRETTAPQQTPAERIMEPALRSGMTAKASPQDLGPSYQAALALSFLADTDETKGEKDIDNEPSVAEKWLSEQPSRPTALAGLDEIKIRSPFPEAQQPVTMADGGDVSTAAQMLRSMVPMDLRTFGSTLFGDRSQITEGNFNPEELAAMQQAVDKAAARTGQTQKGSVQYQDYPKGEEIGPGFQPVGQTLGRFTYEKSPNGQTVITDRYDFYNEGRKPNVEAYEKMGGVEKGGTVAYRMLKNLLKMDPRSAINELGDAYIGREGRDVRIQLPVKRAEGSPKEGETAEPTAEELAAASKPAFLTPKSGIGRKTSTKPGEIEAAALQGVSETPYNVLGAPVDLVTMAMRPFGYDVKAPVGGSDWIKEKMTQAGIRPEAPTGPTQRAFYELGQLGGSSINPAAPVRGAVAGAQATGKAAKELLQDFQQYNQQLSVPGASYAVRQRGTPFIMSYGNELVNGAYPLMDQPEKYVRELANTNDYRLNEWFSNKVTPYLRRDFASPEDQFVRAAEENKLLHFAKKPTKRDAPETQEQLESRLSLEGTRLLEGFPAEGVAKTPYGKRVEALVDESAWPAWLEDISSPGLVPPSMRSMVKTDPSARVTELGTNIEKTIKLEDLRDGMLEMRQLGPEWSAYGQPPVKVPKEYMLTDESLIGLTPAQASQRVAQFRNWRDENRQRMASRFAKEDPRLPREELPGGVTAVQLPDLQSSPDVKQLALDVGCDGNWCTKQEALAMDYGSGDNRLHILVDDKARPMAQLTMTRSPRTGTYSITEMMGKDNSEDFANSPILPALQQYIKSLDAQYDLSYVMNLKKIRMEEMNGDTILQGGIELARRRQRFKPGMSSEEFSQAYKPDVEALESVARNFNGGSKYLTYEEETYPLVKKALELLAPQQRATGGLIERQSTDNRKYL